jgi:tetratricopeptide (TPR) repeat protein
VLFYLAHEHQQDGAPDEARKVYLDLIKGWPLSRYLPTAYVALADMYFDEATRDPAKLALAEKAYKEALRRSPAEHPYVHYKLGFVHWNKGDFAQAMAEMLKAIEASEATAKPPQISPIAREARRDLVPLYAAGSDAAKAYDFFAAHSGDKPGETERLHAALEALVRVYVDTGKLEEAAEVYVDWLSRGAGAKACALVTGIDGVVARAAGSPGVLAKVQRTTQASAPLMKARVECAAAGP